MRKTTQILLCLLPLPFLIAAGCSRIGRARLVNEMTFPLEGISEVKIAYDEERITYVPGDGDQLVVREYMNANKNSYYAKVTKRDGRLHISEGGKPLGRAGFLRYVEVCLPAGYGGTFLTSTTSGHIDLTGVEVALDALQADTTSGTIRLGSVAASSVRLTTTSGVVSCDALRGEISLETKSGAMRVGTASCPGGTFAAHTTSGTYTLGTVAADRVEIRTTSGSVECGEVRGHINYITTSGSLSIGSAAGSGSFAADNQGEVEVAFSQVRGDVSLYNKNGHSRLVLPADLAFHFQGITRNGSISTPFDAGLRGDGDALTGDVGDDPAVTVRVETREGTITVVR